MASGLLKQRQALFVARIVPDTIEASRVAGGIPDGMANIAVSEIVLDQAGIDTHIGQRKATRVTQHVRVDLQRQSRLVARRGDNLIELLAGKGIAFAGEKQPLAGGLRPGVANGQPAL